MAEAQPLRVLLSAAGEAIVEGLPVGVAAVDDQGAIVLVNAECERLFGYTREEMLGRQIELLIPERIRPGHLAHRASFGTDPHRRPMGIGRDLCGRRKDGSEFPAEVGLNPIATPAGSFVLSIIADISDRKRDEEVIRETNDLLRQSNRELERYALVASHDLQTPLRTAGNFLGLLRDTYGDMLDEQATDWLRRSDEAILRMHTLVRDLLEYARARTMLQQPESVALDEVVDEALAVLESDLRETGATVTHDTLPVVTGDRSQLVQLMTNLIGNALKYRASDAPAVRIAAERRPREWCLSVQDNGIGIDPRHHDRIFELFARLHTDREHPGTGIGLALCRRIVEDHGGAIWVSSEPGAGSTFSFTIPAAGADR